MARKAVIRKAVYSVYLDDETISEEELERIRAKGIDNPSPTRCVAIEVDQDDPPEEGVSTYTLKSMTVKEALNLSKLQGKEDAPSLIFEALERSLTSWAYVHDTNGNEVELQPEYLQLMDIEEASALIGFVVGKASGKASNQGNRLSGTS